MSSWWPTEGGTAGGQPQAEGSGQVRSWRDMSSTACGRSGGGMPCSAAAAAAAVALPSWLS